MSYLDKLKGAIDNAPEAGFINVNYGRLSTKIQVMSWQEVDGVRTPVRRAFVENEELKKNETVELEFTIHISEVNPALNFDYTRNVQVRKSANGQLTDWSETVLPSLEKVFGKDKWIEVLTGKKQVYVSAEHLDSVIKAKEGKKNYGVPRFTGVFKSLDECKAAREERYGKSEASEGAEIGIPEAVIKQAKGLFESVGKNEKAFKKMVADAEPFNAYDADALLEEVKAA